MKKYCLLVITAFAFLQASSQNVTLDWMKQLGAAGENINGHYMGLDSGKYVYVGGYFTGTIDFDPGAATANLTSNGSTDIFIAKYDSAGNFKWVRQIGSTPGEDIRGLKVDKRGNVIFTGYYQSTIDMDPGPGTVTVTNTGVNSFITKLDANGLFIWSKQLELEGCNVLQTDAQNNIYIGGDFSGSYDFDPGPGAHTLTAPSVLDEDLFILKLNENGEYVWARNMNNGGNTTVREASLAVDQQGAVYMAGNFTGPMDFDPGAGVFTLSSAGGQDCYVVKLDNTGNFNWAKSWGATNTDFCYDMIADDNGNIFVTGAFDLTVDFDPGPGTFNLTSTDYRNSFLLKLANNGSFLFAKQFTGNSFGQSLALDNSGNIYVAGGFYGPADFDPGPGTNIVNGGNIFITRLDPAGNLVWVAAFQNQIVGSYESIYVCMQVDNLKNVYYSGIFPFAVDFDPSGATFIATPNGTNDMPIVKLNGQCRTNGPTLQVTACDGYTFNGTTYTSSGTYTQTLAGSGGCDSLVTLNLTITQIVTSSSQTSCGSYNWNGNLYTSSGIYRDTLTAANGCDSIVNLTLTINPLPNPQLGADAAICTNETLALYPGLFDSYTWNNGSNNDTLTINTTGIYWVNVSLNGCTARDSIIINPKTGCPGSPCSLGQGTIFYPNPCTTTLFINKENTDCAVYLNLYNALGQTLIKNRLLTNGINSINMKSFASGTYFYKLHDMHTVLKRGKVVKGRP